MTTERRTASRHPAAISLLLTVIVILAALAGAIPPLKAHAAVSTQQAANSIRNGVYGIDVSKYQGNINWKQVAADNVSFTMCRATYGTTIDPYFVTNAKNAYENGLDVGAYHFARFYDSASVRREANAFLAQLRQVTITYPVALDIETNPYKLTKANLTSLCIEFLDILAENGYRTLVYSYQNFLTGDKSQLNLSSLRNYDIWAANYLEEPSTISGRVMWQYSSKGRVSGISGDVDLNVAYSSLSAGRRASVPEEPAPLSASKSGASPYGTIIDFLNEQYSASLSVNADHGMDELNHIIYGAFQTEANRQLGASLKIDGVMTVTELDLLSDITFTQDKTKGRITTLIQSKLYFKRLTETINGVYDSAMVSALKSLQNACGLEPTGYMDRDTWIVILGL